VSSIMTPSAAARSSTAGRACACWPTRVVRFKDRQSDASPSGSTPLQLTMQLAAPSHQTLAPLAVQMRVVADESCVPEMRPGPLKKIAGDMVGSIDGWYKQQVVKLACGFAVTVRCSRIVRVCSRLVLCVCGFGSQQTAQGMWTHTTVSADCRRCRPE
jgi:hypothetical protein